MGSKINRYLTDELPLEEKAKFLLEVVIMMNYGKSLLSLKTL